MNIEMEVNESRQSVSDLIKVFDKSAIPKQIPTQTSSNILILDETPIQRTNSETSGSETRGKMGTRGGLSRIRIVEPNLQPANIKEKIFGDLGEIVPLKSNFTTFKVLGSKSYMVYDSVFSPIVMSPKMKLELIIRICQYNKLPGAFCFDGRRLFTSEKWHGEAEDREFNTNDKKMTIRLVSTIFPETEEYYQMINVLLNNLQIMLGQERIGKGYFLSPYSTKDKVSRNSETMFFETNNFKILGGFGTTLQRAMNPSCNLTTLLYIERINLVLNDNSVLTACNHQNIDQLIGRDIITKYNNKTYRINEIKEMSMEDKFEIGGEMVSYYDYFKKRYNIRLTRSDQPFVVTRVKKPQRRGKKKNEGEERENESPEDKYLTLNIPGQLCFLCGFSDQEKSNTDLQKSLRSVLKREPREILNDIPAYCNWLEQSESAQGMCNKWQLKIDNKPLIIEGRELPPCDVISCEDKINENLEDDWRFGKVHFNIGRYRKHEIDVVIVDRYKYHYEKFIKDVEQELRNMRVEARIGKVNVCKSDDVEKHLNDCTRSSSDCLKMALVFVPDDRVYGKVKSFTMNTGLLTQCVTTKNGTNRNDRRRKVVSSKTVMQIFSKFGYDPWTVDMDMKPAMIIGMYTYYNKLSKKSIQASVFSYNETFTQYMSFVNSLNGRQEFHETLEKNFNLALEEYEKNNSNLLQRIIVYRDGVDDSQLQFTKNFEVDPMKSLFESICRKKGMPEPQIIYVIVKKRIGTKLFNRENNPNPGTIVDKEIVKPNFYEFFLVSQRTTMGTTTPTNYNVLEDTFRLSKDGIMAPMTPNDLQRLTYALTHLYFNWMGTIRVPVPVHYARRLAELADKVYKGSPPAVINERIRNRLFYL